MHATALIDLFKAPEGVKALADAQWHAVVEIGRKTQTLGQLAALLERRGLAEAVPSPVRRHLELARLTALRRTESALWEVRIIRQSVDASIPLVLLKGAAYAACGDRNGQGRLFTDVDLLVPRTHLPATESALFGAGWKPGRVNAYDARYYRDWMHEVPPMEHVRRHTVVDLHHAINPPVSRFHVDPARLFHRTVEVQPGIFVLCPADRVIHCCLHLLQEGEPRKLLRDLYDLHVLVEQHFASPTGRAELLSRATELNVARLVATATGAARDLFGTTGAADSGARWLQSCLQRSAREGNDASPSVLAALSGTVVLAYSHWMKMPLHLLIPHLVRKSLLRLSPDRDKKS